MYLRLVYISTMRRPLDEAECTQILAASRRNNGADGITGLLVAGGNRFLQLLEGPAAVVERCFHRIGRDPRHFAVVTLDRRETSERQCPDWAMGFLPGGCAADGASLGEIVEALVGPIADKNLKAQFTGFAQIQSAA
ncbi:BLUF domain-containing protein [Sphingomonas ginkgonis]|uniref:BLUF domain-containing protein n=1 Tax=Sphingomonas ginkgonis TaxID=2315330 RepID=A0A3R9YJX3_9SPHN|nr:BLUF domain-containing protein [Sphingomonas ginkgonis]RST29446.1 BLUF domain-containing protein [Sphingomonas ginkgonis]